MATPNAYASIISAFFYAYSLHCPSRGESADARAEKDKSIDGEQEKTINEVRIKLMDDIAKEFERRIAIIREQTK